MYTMENTSSYRIELRFDKSIHFTYIVNFFSRLLLCLNIFTAENRDRAHKNF